ncbi:LPS-assembly protein LptD [Sporomusa acidovorans]|uniref:LPS-assembly protein LptD n=1 Tax=Sporomusa acidovorans (strain ATCC 49682 / DSM 3132 / Mol) TaxID=1123286 RepID=A0ABZ3J719_SPOA4|nr:LPS-assembly protein LptD [Sporomusa acidovorans]OZC19318.1 LPS-assembly protein LptD [Sporomusa acidovorans DSM 3132]SDD80954.1 LPS-assembly protein [Sporomusa acidovorans]
MPNNKMILGVLALTIVFGAYNISHAQEQTTTQEQSTTPQSTTQQTTTQQPATQKSTTPQPPIVIEANELSFSDETGDILANGKVVITNQGQRLETEHLDGNSKLNEIWINDTATFSETGTSPSKSSNLTGNHVIYNYKLKTGSMEQAKGKIERKYVSGETISVLPDKYLISHGTATNCPAKIPDYHVSADKIEIWPEDKMIAYNAKFWIGNTVIFSLPKYQQGLGKNAGESSFPRIGYDGDQGLYIKQHLEYPFTNKFFAYANLDYYSKAGYKPSYGLVRREKNFSVEVVDGHFLDNDDNWIKKEPEFRFSYHSRRLGQLPVSYTFTASYGKWIDSSKTSWHQEYEVYFTRDPIKLNSTMNLHLGTGYEIIHESYDNSVQNIFKYDITVDKKWSDRFTSYVGYHYTQPNKTLFAYDSDDMNRELDAGITYKIDHMNSIGVVRNYDLDSKKVEDLNYIWYRNLHCWQGTLTYKSKENKWKFDITTTRW